MKFDIGIRYRDSKTIVRNKNKRNLFVYSSIHDTRNVFIVHIHKDVNELSILSIVEKRFKIQLLIQL